MAEEEKESAFKVQDRRRVSADTAELRQEEDRAGRKETPSPSKTGGEDLKTHKDSTARPSLEITFSSFILSLTTQALMCLGEIPNPQDGTPCQDLPAAKQVIDILGLLKEKTPGNLTQSEERLLEQGLFDLRMKYVEIVRKK